jgi:small-conductance mechanosensitive channel
VRSALGLAIHDALRDAGIEIPFPQQDLHLRSVEPGLFDRMQAQRPRPPAADAAAPPAGA